MSKNLQLFDVRSTHQSKVAYAILLGLLALLLIVGFTTPLLRCGDTSAYYMQISSISEDFDIEYRSEDIQRTLDNRFGDLPAGLILMKTDEDRYFYSKEYSYALFAAPFYSFFGNQGIILFNMLLFWLMIFIGYLYLRRTNADLIALGMSTAFFLISTTFVYTFWIHAEVYNMFLICAGIFSWLMYRESKNYKILMISALIFGIATVAKLPNLLVFAPIVCYEIFNLEKKHALLMLTLILLPIVAFYSFFYLSTGVMTFYGGDRFYYISNYPFNNGYDAEREAGYPANSMNAERLTIMLTDIENIKIIPYNIFYFFFGRFTGMVWYYPFTVFAIIPLMLSLANGSAKSSKFSILRDHILKNKEKYLILLGIILSILMYAVIFRSNYLGGQHAIGNRYFYIYPAFLFLIGYVDLKKVLAFTAVAALVLAPVIADPISTTISPQETTFHFPYKYLPIEYSQLDNLPIWQNQIKYAEYKLYGLDTNFKHRDDMLIVTGHSEFLIRSSRQIDTFRYLLSSGVDENRVEVVLGDKSESRILGKENVDVILFSAIQPAYHDNRYYLYKLIVESDKGISLKPIFSKEDCK